MRIRGVIEGFYGPPWSHAERLDLIALLRRAGPEHLGARAEGRSVPPRALARAVSRRRAGAACRARRRGGARRRVRLRDRAGPRHPLLETSRSSRRSSRSASRCAAPASRRSSCSGTTSSTLTAPSTSATAERPRRGQADFSEPLRARSAAARSSSARWATRAPATRRTGALRRRARPADRRLLDGPGGRLARRSRARSSTPPSRASATSSCSGTTIPSTTSTRDGSSSGRCAGATRGSPTGGSRARRERDAPGGAVEAPARDGRGLGARPGRLRPARVVRARAPRPRRRGASRRCGALAEPRDVEPPPTSRRSSRRSPPASTPRRRSRCSSRSCDRRRRLRRDRGGRRGRRRGARAPARDVVLVEPGAHIGGMVSGGLCWTDVGDARVLGGFARRFYAAVAEHYGAALWEVKGPEPHVAERLLTSLLDGVDVRLGDDDAARTLRSTSTRATRATCWRGSACRTRSGASRASSTASVGGTAARVPAGKHNFPVMLSPFADDGSLLPFIREPELDERGWPAERLGEGDGGLQAYGFRLCLTDRPTNRLPFERAARLRRGASSSCSRRYLAAAGVEARDLLGLVPDLLPNGKCDVNSIGPFSLNLLDGIEPRVPRRRRRDAAACARTTSATRRRSSASSRRRRRRASARGARWGLVRRRVHGHRRLAAPALRARRRAACSASTCCASPTCSTARRRPTSSRSARTTSTSARSSARGATCPSTCATPAVFNEGYLSVAGAAVPDPVPLADAAPRGRENLLVPVCLSASHVAFGSVRMEPTLMLLGARRRASRRRRPRAAASRCRTSTSSSSSRRCATGAGARLTNAIAFMTANYVARETGYAMHGWGHGDRMTNEALRAARDLRGALRRAARDVRALGFDAIDLWGAHLNPAWATDEHVDAAREALDRHGLRVDDVRDRGSTPANVERACEIALALGTDALGGGFAGRRGGARRRCSASAGSGSRSRTTRSGRRPSCSRRSRAATATFGATVDTGWWATQGYDAARAIEELGEHVLHVHLKDVLARASRTRRAAWARGSSTFAECVRALQRIGYAGAIAHRARARDVRSERRPSRDARAARGVARVRVALVGAGVIASATRRGSRRPRLELAGATDVLPGRAPRPSSRSTAASAYGSLEELLADDRVDIVVNLTAPSSHAAVTRAALDAGKHVHTEKPLALRTAEARELAALATERGVRLSCAPATLLGEAQQTAWKLVRDGRSAPFASSMPRRTGAGSSRWHPSPESLYEVGPLVDVGIYPLTILTAMFGPVRRVSAYATTLQPERTRTDGRRSRSRRPTSTSPRSTSRRRRRPADGVVLGRPRAAARHRVPRRRRVAVDADVGASPTRGCC